MAISVVKCCPHLCSAIDRLLLYTETMLLVGASRKGVPCSLHPRSPRSRSAQCSRYSPQEHTTEPRAIPESRTVCSFFAEPCSRRKLLGSLLSLQLLRQPFASAKLVIPSGPSSRNLDQALRVSPTHSFPSSAGHSQSFVSTFSVADCTVSILGKHAALQ